MTEGTDIYDAAAFLWLAAIAAGAVLAVAWTRRRIAGCDSTPTHEPPVDHGTRAAMSRVLRVRMKRTLSILPVR